MPKTWATRQRERGVRLELTPFEQRNCWKKFRNGKVHYLHFPLTRAGYEAALLEWRSRAADADRDRPHAQNYHYHRDLFRKVLDWYDQFGVPRDEAELVRQVAAFVEWLDGQLQQPVLPSLMPFFAFTHSRGGLFYDEFVKSESGYTTFGSEHYRLPGKWQERLRQLDDRPDRFLKEPQTIGHWIDRYLSRTSERAYDAIKIRTAADRVHKLADFKRWMPLGSHVMHIDDDAVRRYHAHLARSGRSRATKEGYFKAFRMFVRWAAKQSACELAQPANLEDREFVFRDSDGVGRRRERKKQFLWTAQEFGNVLEVVPQPYRCYLVLMLNCGFRNSDLSHLRKVDLRLDEGRIVYQREKLNQNDTSPVVSYLLWPQTQQLLSEVLSDDEVFVFATATGGRLVVEKRNATGREIVYDTVSRYWRRNRKRFGLDGKRLDYIRKSGSTFIERHRRGIEVLYLADSLTSVPRIHYNFNDGEATPELDDAIQHLGNAFGICDQPTGQILHISDAVLQSLEEKAKLRGMTVNELLASV